MANEEKTKKKLKVGLFDYLFLLLLLIGVVTVSIVTFSNTSRTQPTPSNPETYTVEFDVNIKGAQIESLKVNEGGLVTKPEDPSKTGYTFGGWFRDEACEYKWDFAKDKVTGNTTLYPKWTINTYTVSFNLNGHGAKVDSQTIDYDKLVVKPTDPSETGYTFSGWYKEAACENIWKFAENKVTASTTLYAKWTINTYTVTFDMNDHGTQIEPLTVGFGGLVEEPTDPTETGYNFGGWYKDEGLNFKWDFEDNTINSSTTLYAKWVAEPIAASYTVSFNMNGIGDQVAPQTITEGDTVDEPAAPTDSDNVFDGWYKDALCEHKWDFDNDTVNADTTLYAKWTASYVVEFDMGINYCKSKYGDYYYPEIEESVPSRKIGYCGLVTIPTTPVDEYDDFTFAGWYRDSARTVEWDFANDVITKNTTIYAKWVQTICTVYFNLSGRDTNENCPDTQYVHYLGKINNPAYTQPTFNMTTFPYTFTGWYSDSSCGYQYIWDFENDIVTDDMTLYAGWIEAK